MDVEQERAARAASEPRYYARSASDRNPDWPIWFVADRQKGGLNVSGKLWELRLGEPSHGGKLFAPPDVAKALAAWANENLS